MMPDWTPEQFYDLAARPNNAPPTPMEKPAPPATTKTASEVNAEDFYAKAVKVVPGVTGKAVQPTPTAAPTTPTPAAAAPSAESIATAADLKTLGIEPPDGVAMNADQIVKFHDAAIKNVRAMEDARISEWEKASRALPAADIAAAESFAATHLDAEVRDVLASSGLGSHPAIVKLAAKLQAAFSGR